jgi:rhodanese-related sulfurtransferase
MKKAIILGFFLAAFAAFAAGGGEQSPAIAQSTQASGFAAQPLSSEELAGLIGQPNLYLVDVRTAEEYRAGAIPSAVNIPFDLIQNNLPTQDRDARIVVYCRSGNRSSAAKATLEELGFANVNNFGPVSNWKSELVVR